MVGIVTHRRKCRLTSASKALQRHGYLASLLETVSSVRLSDETDETEPRRQQPPVTEMETSIVCPSFLDRSLPPPPRPGCSSKRHTTRSCYYTHTTHYSRVPEGNVNNVCVCTLVGGGSSSSCWPLYPEAKPSPFVTPRPRSPWNKFLYLPTAQSW